METTDTTRDYSGWSISFGMSPNESDYGTEPFGPELDFDASVCNLERIEIAAVQAAFPGAVVETVWGLSPSWSTETKAYGPASTPHDDEEKVIETVDAIREEMFARMETWVIAAGEVTA